MRLLTLISLSRERGLLCLRHWSPQSLALRFGTNSLIRHDPHYELMSQAPPFVLSRLLSSLWVSRTGSASDWCALQGALYKRIDTIQYNKIQFMHHHDGCLGLAIAAMTCFLVPTCFFKAAWAGELFPQL